MLLAVVVVYTAVITNIPRRAHTPAIQTHNSEIKPKSDKAVSKCIFQYIVSSFLTLSDELVANSYLGPVEVMRQVD